ncbi:hypothetical protein [Alicyclobacillus shizuokensis]|nr:hypothetical protein [Alicyclobacillus shizuokensis]MCL6626549.1 hypothetical protein [Alicyclobacillus shizuokensis]
MFLHKIPAIRVPQPVIYAAAIFLGTFYFWFTRPAEEPGDKGPLTRTREI